MRSLGSCLQNRSTTRGVPLSPPSTSLKRSWQATDLPLSSSPLLLILFLGDWAGDWAGGSSPWGSSRTEASASFTREAVASLLLRLDSPELTPPSRPASDRVARRSFTSAELGL